MARAFVFPGQGSQAVGMGKALADAAPEARAVFDTVDEALGERLSALMFDGDADTLTLTQNAQPALMAVSLAALKVLEAKSGRALDDMAAFVAGHSLGELTALTAAEALPFEAGIRLVRERGRLMHEAGERESGGMAALLGLETDQVHAICKEASEQTGKPLVLANDNCPGQVVISGDTEALNVALELAKRDGARRAIRLAVSTAPHSPLMQPAQAAFDEVLKHVDFRMPQVPVYANSTAQPLTTIAGIRQELDAQLTQPVHWTAIIQRMIADGVTHFVEIGPGDVLTGLLRRIDRNVQRSTINSLESLRAFIATSNTSA